MIPVLSSIFLPPIALRLDDIVVFEPLEEGQLLGIARLMAMELNQRVAHKNITLEVSDSALQFAVRCAYDHMYGARPLRRWLEQHVITDLSRMIVAGAWPGNRAENC